MGSNEKHRNVCLSWSTNILCARGNRVFVIVMFSMDRANEKRRCQCAKNKRARKHTSRPFLARVVTKSHPESANPTFFFGGWRHVRVNV